eukprot:6204195-Pleurochrysis_carterae.AAC.6
METDASAMSSSPGASRRMRSEPRPADSQSVPLAGAVWNARHGTYYCERQSCGIPDTRAPQPVYTAATPEC